MDTPFCFICSSLLASYSWISDPHIDSMESAMQMQLLSNILLQNGATQIAGRDSTLDKSVLCCRRQIIASYVIMWQLFSHTDIKQCISQMVGNECLTATTHTTRNRGHGSGRSGSIFLALELSVKYFASKCIGNRSIVLVENHVWNSRSTGLLLSF
jgi:hypothetical protein